MLAAPGTWPLLCKGFQHTFGHLLLHSTLGRRQGFGHTCDESLPQAAYILVIHTETKQARKHIMKCQVGICDVLQDIHKEE